MLSRHMHAVARNKWLKSLVLELVLISLGMVALKQCAVLTLGGFQWTCLLYHQVSILVPEPFTHRCYLTDQVQPGHGHFLKLSSTWDLHPKDKIEQAVSRANKDTSSS